MRARLSVRVRLSATGPNLNLARWRGPLRTNSGVFGAGYLLSGALIQRNEALAGHSVGLGLSCTLALGMGARAAKTRAAVPVAVAGVGALASVYYGIKVREWSS